MIGNGGDVQNHGCGFLSTPEVDAFLDGSLSRERRAEFAAHLDEGCPECLLLAADLRTFEQVASRGPTATEREEFQAGAEMLQARLAREVRESRGTPPRRAAAQWIAVAAAAVLLGVVSLAIFRVSGPGVPGSVVRLPDGTELAVEPMPFSPPPTVRGELTAHEIWERAGDSYEREEFAEAAELLSELGDEGPHAADAALYRGVSLLMAGRPAESRQALRLARSIAEQEQLPAGSIRWFEGLAALADDDFEAGLSAVREAADAPGPHAEPARKLLERLSPE